jgi:putative component of toxin-antitoxin plasmid stabilization module
VTAPGTCSETSLAHGEDLSATAPTAQTWIVIEQHGPWGNRALIESRLDRDLGASLIEATSGTGTTVLLARPFSSPTTDATDASTDSTPDGAADGHRVWFAHTSPGGVRMRLAHITDLTGLLDLDFNSVARGELPGLGAKTADPVLFICTNGKRDVCCAVKGREVLRSLASGPDADVASAVFEVSHLGGHRFAPTALLLPHGTVHGRLNVSDAVEILRSARAGQIHRTGYRGRSTWLGSEQAAEIAVRDQESITGIDDLDVLRVAVDTLDREHVRPARVGTHVHPAGAVVNEVRHRDGRAWRVELATRTRAARPESCGGDAVESQMWVAQSVQTSHPWR